MNTGAKVAIGCVVAVVGAGTLAVVGLGLGAFWLKDKAETLVGEQTKIVDLQKRADGNRFARPVDAVIPEDRLVKFLEVRKRVFAVYEQHKSEIDARGSKKQGDLGDVKAFLGILNEVRLAQAQALADLGMSTEEYRFLVESIYKSAWASGFQKEMGRPPSAVIGEAVQQAQEAVKQGVELARAQGVPEAEKASDADVAKAQQQIGEALSGVKNLDVPAANIELFRKHEAEIKKYAMAGLELLGF